MVYPLLIAVASLVVEHRLQGAQASVAEAHGLSSFGSLAPEYRLKSCEQRPLQPVWIMSQSSLTLRGAGSTVRPPRETAGVSLHVFSLNCI